MITYSCLTVPIILPGGASTRTSCIQLGHLPHQQHPEQQENSRLIRIISYEKKN